MLIDEIFIALLFKNRVEICVKFIQNIFKRGMKMTAIFRENIIWSKIRASAEPAVDHICIAIIQFEIPPVGMHCRHKWVQWMQHQRQAGCKKMITLYIEHFFNGGGQSSLNRKIGRASCRERV